MEKIDIILDSVKALYKRNRDIVIEVTRSNANEHNSVVSIIAGDRHAEIEIDSINPNNLVAKLNDEYEFVKNVTVMRKYYEKPPVKTKVELPPRPEPSAFNPFENVSDNVYAMDRNFPNFTFLPNSAYPMITLDKNGRLNPNSSAMSYLGLGYNDVFALGYNAIDKEIAIIPGHYGNGDESTYKIDSRNYASARYFAARYGYIGKKSLFKLIGTSESSGIKAYIFRLIEA